MIKVYSVQTFYGIRSKLFIHSYNAIDYYKKLCSDFDPDLVELYTLQLSDNDFIYTDFDD